jgi:hypothetical protein
MLKYLLFVWHVWTQITGGEEITVYKKYVTTELRPATLIDTGNPINLIVKRYDKKWFLTIRRCFDGCYNEDIEVSKRVYDLAVVGGYPNLNPSLWEDFEANFWDR